MALRVLEQVSFSLNYYNIRSYTISAELNKFAGLIIALKKAGFIFKYWVEEKFNPVTDAVIDQQLQQI